MGLFYNRQTINPERPWDSTNYKAMPEVKNMRIVKVNVSDIKFIRFKDQLGNIDDVTVTGVFVTDKGRLYGAGDFMVKPEQVKKT